MMIGTNLYTAIGLFSIYPAVKAYEKGRSFIKWYLFSVMLFPVALVASFYIKKNKLL